MARKLRNWREWRPSAALSVFVFLAILGLCIARLIIAPPQELHEQLRMWTPAGYAAAGMFVWRRRPGILVGPAIAVSGLGWGLGYLTINNDEPITFTISQLTAYWWIPLLTWAFLAFPQRRLNRWDRVLVGLTVLHWCVLSPVVMPFYAPEETYCAGCPSGLNLLLVDSRPGFVTDWLNWNIRWYLFVHLAVLVTLLVRFVRSSGPARLVLAPVVLPVVLDYAIGVTQMVTEQINVLGGGTAFNDWSLNLRIWLGLVAAVGTQIGIVVGALAEVRRRERAGRLARLSDPSALQDAVRQALSDDTAALSSAVSEPPTGAGRRSTPLRLGDDAVGWLVCDEAAADDPRLLAAVTATAALILGSQRKIEQLSESLADVQESRGRLVRADEDVRRQVERELAAGPGAQLRIASQTTRQAALDAPEELRPALRALHAEIENAMSELRDLARGLAPSVLADRGLGPALRALAADAPVPTTVLRVPEQRLPTQVEAAAWFVAAEAVANAAKHAGASRLTIEAFADLRTLSLSVRDDGCGGAAASTGGGLAGLADRVADQGGTLHVESPPGGGTTISAEFPLHQTVAI
jgi:signal transduction histidine kinase